MVWLFRGPRGAGGDLAAPPLEIFPHLCTHMHTNLSTHQFLLQHLCSHISSYAQMSTFVIPPLLFSPFKSPSTPPPTQHSHPALYLLPCLLPHSLLHPYLHIVHPFPPPSVFPSLSLCSSLHPAYPRLPSSIIPSCTDIAHFPTISASLLSSFIVFFPSLCLGIL